MIAAIRGALEWWSRRSVAVRWSLPLAWAGLIWWLSSRSPSGRAPGMGLVLVMNGAHVVVFGVLAAMVHAALSGGSARFGAGLGRFAVACAVASVYGAVDEIHQAFVPGRQSSVFDWTSDTSGALLCAAVLSLVRERAPWARTIVWIAVPTALVSVACATVW
jgi:hypothetical protein